MGAAIRTTKYQGMCNCHFQAPLEVQIKGTTLQLFTGTIDIYIICPSKIQWVPLQKNREYYLSTICALEISYTTIYTQGGCYTRVVEAMQLKYECASATFRKFPRFQKGIFE